ADRDADVCALVEGDALEVHRKGTLMASVDVVDARPTNVACAVAVALELGVAEAEVVRLLPGLPVAPNRLTVAVAATGVTVVDDDEEQEDDDLGERNTGGDATDAEAAAGEHAAQVVLVSSRDEAVSWVKAHLGEGDVVLYENDLPDHFP